MAGDWIKVRRELPYDQRVMNAAESLKVSDQRVVGCLVQFWGWVDAHVSGSCPVSVRMPSGHDPDECVRQCTPTGVSPERIDRLVELDGFVDAIAREGWLVVRDGKVFIPSFGRHFSKSAKQRALDQQRKARRREELSGSCPDPVRSVSGSCPDPVRSVSGSCPDPVRSVSAPCPDGIRTRPGPEKRREDDVPPLDVEKKKEMKRRTQERAPADAPADAHAHAREGILGDEGGEPSEAEGGGMPERDLWHELQQPPFMFRKQVKIMGILERGLTPEDLDAWRAYARSHGDAAAVAGIQTFRTPGELTGATEASREAATRSMIEECHARAKAGYWWEDPKPGNVQNDQRRRPAEGGPR